MQKDQALELEALRERTRAQEQFVAKYEQMMSEMDGKLNALIHIVDLWIRHNNNGKT